MSRHYSRGHSSFRNAERALFARYYLGLNRVAKLAQGVRCQVSGVKTKVSLLEPSDSLG